MPDFAPIERSNDVPEDAPHGGVHMARALADSGVDTIFALCGGHILPLLDACGEAGIRIIDHRHEGAATLAAEGYALATGRTGVAAVTAGAGFVNGLVGFADAGMWSVPMVMIAGHAPIRQWGRGAVQEAPQIEMAAPVAKDTILCLETSRIDEVTRTALHRARSGKPGPVYLEMPQDVFAGQANEPESEVPTGYPAELPRSTGAPIEIERVLAALKGAERPVILAGGGTFWSGAGEALARFCEISQIPVTTTSAARGVIADSHPLCLGSLMHGGGAVFSADVVMVLGSAFNANASFGLPPLFPAGQTVIQVDITSDGIGGPRCPEIGVVGDIRSVLEDLTRRWGPPSAPRSEWMSAARELETYLKSTWDSQIEAHTGSRIHCGSVAREMVAWAREVIGDELTFVADGGDALTWGIAYMYAEGPGRLLSTTTALGTLGVGLPFALGAAAARPGEPVIALLGDGAFGFSGMEFDSAVRQGLQVICVISNNFGWRDVSHEQDMWFGQGRRFASELSDTRYDKLGEALGGHGEHVTSLDQLRPALERSLASGLPSIINVETDSEVLSDLLRNLGSMGLN